jgi:hypothetical protein
MRMIAAAASIVLITGGAATANPVSGTKGS